MQNIHHTIVTKSAPMPWLKPAPSAKPAPTQLSQSELREIVLDVMG